MSKKNELEEIVSKIESLERKEELFENSLSESKIDVYLFKQGDPIQYEIGLNEFEKEIIYEVEKELIDFRYGRKDPDIKSLLTTLANNDVCLPEHLDVYLED